MRLPKILFTISKELSKEGAALVVVGGSVRDYFLKIPVKDYDIEVFGLKNIETLERILLKHGDIKLVGKSFGVIKFIYQKNEYDFSFPRRERKIGKGHRGFEVTTDSFMDFKEAARRRDFTINAMGYDIKSAQILDPFDGRKDLKNKILRHIDDETFVEDPLRIYRGVQFCARFCLSMDLKTKILCKNMIKEGALLELPKERVFEEIKKLLLKSQKPSSGFDLLKELGALCHLNPLDELDGSKWELLLKRVDFAVTLKRGDDKKDLILFMCALCMDMKLNECERFIKNLIPDKSYLKEVVKFLSLVRSVSKIFEKENIEQEIRKLSTKVCIEDLVYVCKVYLLALRGEKSELCDTLYSKALKLGVLKSAPKPLVLGRDLVKLGYEPSSKFKEILEKVYQMQLEGKITAKEKALEFIKEKDVL